LAVVLWIVLSIFQNVMAAEPAFFGARLEPPAGKTLHGWGQLSDAWARGDPAGDSEARDLAIYEKEMAPYEPAMISFYVAPDDSILSGFIDRYGRFVKSHRPFVAQVGLYFQSFAPEVAAGQRDAELRRLAAALRDAHVPVLLRIGYEFNNPWTPYDSANYRVAFRRVAEIMASSNASNVAAVWNATAVSLDDRDFMAWYPGDDVVDWWSINLFGMYDFSRTGTARFLDEARKHRKPILIGEAAPVFATDDLKRVRGPRSEAEALQWFEALTELIAAWPEIKGVSLIAVDSRRVQQLLPGSGWPDTRLAQWQRVLKIWRDEVANRRFINAERMTSAAREMK